MIRYFFCEYNWYDNNYAAKWFEWGCSDVKAFFPENGKAPLCSRASVIQTIHKNKNLQLLVSTGLLNCIDCE